MLNKKKNKFGRTKLKNTCQQLTTKKVTTKDNQTKNMHGMLNEKKNQKISWTNKSKDYASKHTTNIQMQKDNRT
jgi:hypothetical protein